MNKAIVTGASSGIGKAVSIALIKEGYEVYGIGRTFIDPIDSPFFHALSLDLTNIDHVLHELSVIDFNDLTLFINNAGTAYYGMHETLKQEMLEEMVAVNLTAPMILTSHFTRILRKNKGTIINIASISGTHAAPHGACYGATKAALISFSDSLFMENRKTGMRVTCIIPDMTDTNLYRHADFKADPQQGCSLSIDDITEAILFTLRHPSFVTKQIVLQPQFQRILKK